MRLGGIVIALLTLCLSMISACLSMISALTRSAFVATENRIPPRIVCGARFSGSCCSWRLLMLKEFREFAMKGNVVDLAVGVIIGAAFGAIVNSLVGDVIMPIIGAATGGLDFSNYFTPLSKAVTASNLADAK